MTKFLKPSLLLVILILSINANAQNLSTVKKAIVQSFIECIEHCTWEELSESVSYPLRRIYPTPDIENKADFLLRRTELFDDSLTNLILSSSVDSNWSEVGWRGIMLNHGALWLDEEGKLIAVNYETELEKQQRMALIELDRKELPTSLQVYESTVLQMKTEKFLLRIDEMSDGSYRYAAWLVKTKTDGGEPDEMLENGELNFDGSGGNHSYTFKSEEYTIVCSIIVLGKNTSPPAELLIYRDEQLVRSYPADWLKN